MSSLSDDVFGYDDPYYLKWSTWYQVCFALGMLGAGSVLLTGYMFWKEMVTDKIYMKLLMAMSLCDALASFMGLFGFGHDNEFVCVWQGVTWYFFNRASWMFMMCITLTLFTQVNYDRIFIQFNVLSFVVLIVSVILILLPVIATDKMKYGDEENCDWNIGQLRSKGFKSREDERAAHLFDTWNIYMLYLPFGLISAITLSLLAHMYYTVYLRTLDIHDEGAKFIMRSIHHLLYYPLIMAIFWFPNLIIMIWKGNLARHTVQEQKYIIPILLGSYLWSSVYPVGVALYYFYRSDEARMRWRETLCGASAQVSNEDMVVDAQQDKLSRRRKQGSGRAIKNPAHQDSIDVDL